MEEKQDEDLSRMSSPTFKNDNNLLLPPARVFRGHGLAALKETILKGR